MSEVTKKCAGCCQEKSLRNFYENKHSYFAVCMDCQKARARKRYAEKREEILAASRAKNLARKEMRRIQL